MTNEPLFTVFTPTYNRAHTLHRVFNSLCAQTLRDFEWLIIDDGSTDGTGNLVAGWTKSAEFTVRYIRQDHAHKHVAYNRALKEARGRLLACLDSDDALTTNALERLIHHWNTIPECDRHSFFAVEGLSCDQNGTIVGDRYPIEPLDTNLRELKYVHHLRGEKLRVGLTEIMRRYPFPEISETTYLPEGIVWLDIAKTFKSRAVNEVFRIYYVDGAEPGVTVDRRRSLNVHAPGRWYYYVWQLNNDLGYFFQSPMPFLKAAATLPIVGWFSGRTLARTLASLTSWRARLLVLMALPLATLVYAFEKARLVLTEPAGTR